MSIVIPNMSQDTGYEFGAGEMVVSGRRHSQMPEPTALNLKPREEIPASHSHGHWAPVLRTFLCTSMTRGYVDDPTSS